jgi:hypothetical protein
VAARGDAESATLQPRVSRAGAGLRGQSERLARAELHALRAQISPHFVYNALAAIAGYIHSNPEEARELLTEFAEFTRYAFRGRSPYVTLADELSYVEKYLRLERARFGDRLEVRLRSRRRCSIGAPMLSLQPLVENAVRHGVERRGRGRVEIVGRDIDADVELRVTDDGVGMDGARATEILAGHGRGVGLMNVQARLQAAFGPAYGLENESAPGRGTTVTAALQHYATRAAAAGAASTATGRRRRCGRRARGSPTPPHGDVYLRRLRHAQLQLAAGPRRLRGGVRRLPLALYLLPGLDRVQSARAPRCRSGSCSCRCGPLFIAIGWLYARRADALDAAFRDLVEK